METVIFVNILAVFFALLDSIKLSGKGLLFSFITLFIFLAIRFDYGNDYLMYQYFFDDLNSGKYGDLGKAGEHFETGYTLLNFIFKYFGFEALIMFLSIINVATIYKIIKTYVPREYYWLAVFIYVFNADFMLIHLSALRQMTAIMIMFLSLNYLFNKKYIKYIFCVLLAYLFHTSAIFLVILIPITYFDWTKKTSSLIISSILYFSFFLLSNFFGDFISSFVNLYLGRYSAYSDFEGEVNSGFGFLIYFIFFVFLFISAKSMSVEQRKLMSVSILAIILSTLAIKVMMIFRLNMYFTIFSIVTFPLMVYHLKNRLFKIGLIALMFILYLYGFFGFFESEIYSDYYKVYKTIFDK